jgi:hypothetical protein
MNTTAAMTSLGYFSIFLCFFVPAVTLLIAGLQWEISSIKQQAPIWTGKISREW